MLISPFSAIYSWEGYEYQAHIALYVALCKIKSLINSDDSSINIMALEIEGADDFSLKIDDQYESLHQVKRGSFSLDQDGKKDKFSFIISLLQYDASKGYYHILPSKNIPDDFVDTTIEHINSLLVDLEMKVSSKSELNEDEYENYILIENIRNAKKGTLYNLLHDLCDGNKTKEHVTEIVTLMKKELNTYLLKLKSDGNIIKDEKLMLKFEPSFVDSIILKDASYKIIKDILEIERKEWCSYIDLRYAQYVYSQLYLELKRLVENDYIKSVNKYGCKFKFSDIYNIIVADYKTQSNTIEFQYYLVLDSIKNMFEQYPKRSYSHCAVDDCEDCSDPDNCHLRNQISAIRKLPVEELHSFLYRMMLSEPNIEKPNNLPSDNLINRLLIKLLSDAELLGIEENNLIQALNEEQIYRLTLDSSGEIDEFYDLLDCEIRENGMDKLLLYENDVLITDQLNEENILFEGNKITIIGSNELNELKNISSQSIDNLKKNYCKPKVIKLIDRNVAKEELKK